MVSENPDFARTPKIIEARDELLRAVGTLRALGGEVHITVSGKPVGRFVPVDSAVSPGIVAEAVAFIEQFGATHTLGGGDGRDSWKSLRDEGRR